MHHARALKEINLRTLIESQLGSIVAKYIGVPLRRSIVRRRDLMEILGKYPINDTLISLLPLINSYLGRRGESRRMLYKHRILEKILGTYQILMQKMLLKATPKIINRSIKMGVEPSGVQQKELESAGFRL